MSGDYYNPRSGDPFNPHNPYRVWHSNDLILCDPVLRKRAGVRALDEDETEIKTLGICYLTNSRGIVVNPGCTQSGGNMMINSSGDSWGRVPQGGQYGGSTIGAPIMFQNWGARNAQDLSRQHAMQMGGMPMKWYKKKRNWN